MSLQETNETFTIVAFRYDERRSILYRNHPIPEEIALLVKRALEYHNADVISIRRVYVKQPESV